MELLGVLLLFVSHVEIAQSQVQAAPLLNANKDCFGACWKEPGFCNYCGKGNACCKAGVDETNEKVIQECRGQAAEFKGTTPLYQCIKPSFSPSMYGPSNEHRISSISLGQCTTFMAQHGCGWTRERSCPNQAIGSRGKAENDGTLQYRCCCGLQLWKGINTRPRVSQENMAKCKPYMTRTGCSWTSDYSCPRQAPGKIGRASNDGGIGYECCCMFGLWEGPMESLLAQAAQNGYNSEAFGLKVGQNGNGGVTTTAIAGTVYSGQHQGQNGGWSVTVGQGTQTLDSNNANALQNNVNAQNSFFNNHGGGNSIHKEYVWNPAAYHGKPFMNALSTAKGPCVFGICTDLDPMHAPGVKFYHGELLYPVIAGAKHLVVHDAFNFKDKNISSVIIGPNSPLSEECNISKIEHRNDLYCTNAITKSHAAGISVAGFSKQTNALSEMFKTYSLLEAGLCPTPITTLAECNEAAVRVHLLDTQAEDDHELASKTDPPWCYLEDAKLKFNSNGGNLGTCSVSDQCLCKAASKQASATYTYNVVSSGRCPNPVITMADCNAAAASIMAQGGIPPGIREAVDDRQFGKNGNGALPPWCYVQGNALKFNPTGANTGSCSTTNQCFCRKLATPGAAPQVPAQAAPSTPSAVPPVAPPSIPTPAVAQAVATTVPQQVSVVRVATSYLVSATKLGQNQIEVANQTLFSVGDYIKIGLEAHKIIGFASILLDSPLQQAYPINTPIFIEHGADDSILTPTNNGPSASLSQGSSNALTWGIGLAALACCCCCIAAGIMLSQFNKKPRKRATDREMDMKTDFIEGQDYHNESHEETQPIMAQPITQSNIMTQPFGNMPPPAPPLLAGNNLYSTGLPGQGSIYNVAAPAPGLGLTTSLTTMPMPGGSMYTGSMYAYK